MRRFFGSSRCVLCSSDCAPELHHVDGNKDNEDVFDWVPLCANHNKEEYYARVCLHRGLPFEMRPQSIDERAFRLTMEGQLPRAYGCNLVGAFLNLYVDADWTVVFSANAINNLRPLFEIDRITDVVARLIVPTVKSPDSFSRIMPSHLALLCKEMGSVYLDFGNTDAFCDWYRLGNAYIQREPARNKSDTAVINFRLTLHELIAKSYRLHADLMQGKTLADASDILEQFVALDRQMMESRYHAGRANVAIHNARVLRTLGDCDAAEAALSSVWTILGAAEPSGREAVPEIIERKLGTWWMVAGLLAEAASIALEQGDAERAGEFANWAYEVYKEKRIRISGFVEIPGLTWFQKEHVSSERAFRVKDTSAWEVSLAEFGFIETAQVVYKCLLDEEHRTRN